MKKSWKLSFVFFNAVLVLAVLGWLASRAFAPGGMRIELTSDLSTVQAGEWAELRFLVLNEDGEVMKEFERVHEKLMHLIVVREDLTQFQHLHPELDEESGEFSVNLSFEEAGPYMIYADFMPEHLSQTVLHTEVSVSGVEDFVGVTLSTNPLDVFEAGPFTVTPSFPEELTTGEELHFSFEVEADGKMVVLEDYLGAKGHCVILREGTLDYLHTHPAEDALAFDAVFDEPGLYQSFTQFQVDGQIYTFDFAFEVSGEVVDMEDMIIQDASQMDH